MLSPNQVIGMAHFTKPVWLTEDRREDRPAHGLFPDSIALAGDHHFPGWYPAC